MDVKEFTKQVLDARRTLPHCDMYVMHRKGTCDYCDRVPELQQYRIDNRINFTNEEEPNLADCPSWETRHRLTIERWSGNVPHVDLGKLYG